MPETLAQKANTALDKKSSQIDSEIASKLAQIRQQALSQESKTFADHFSLHKGLLSAAFSLALVTIILIPDNVNTEANDNLSAMLTQEEILEDPEMLDDIEFIYWLSQADEQTL